MTAPPSASETETGDPLPEQGAHGGRVVERVAEVAVHEVPHVRAVLVEDRPVEAEPARDSGHGVGRRLPAGDRARRVARRHVEHDEDRTRDHPQHDDAEQDPADEEADHRRLRLSEQALATRVERVPDAVPEQVERQRGRQQEDAGKELEPPGDLVEAERLGEHVPPTRRRRHHAEAEERQRRFEGDRGRDQQRQVDEHRREQVREDVDEHDPQVACAERPAPPRRTRAP